ncbi:MAG: FixH family protein [Alphaproteobacteria bacterium]|nr:FixH family protein [Alphaproteobacteria bacterium]
MSVRPAKRSDTPGRQLGELTGRRVFAMLLGFFLLVFAVNGVFIYFSLTSHPGTTARDAYREGLEYNRVLEGAERQQALGWRAEVRERGGTVGLHMRDAAGAAVGGLVGKAEVGRPASDSQDSILGTVETAPGIYEAAGPPLGPGRWKVVFEMEDGAGLRFRVEDELLVTR